MKCLLSIIVPVYNMERFLPECLNSLFAQHFGCEVEVLLIDDGSKDGSENLLQEAAAGEPYFHYIRR